MNQVNPNQNPHSVSGDKELFDIDFREILEACRRQPLLILACVIGLSVILGVYAARKPKEYRAGAQLLIEPVLPKVLGDGFDVEDLGARANAEKLFMNTQFKIIQ